ncbi:MAG TPA: hypothetical protein DDY12_01355 [Porphyromonadaceae bacterium]|nr:hypothetical protein [Porphyromonadaceae bacterium]
MQSDQIACPQIFFKKIIPRNNIEWHTPAFPPVCAFFVHKKKNIVILTLILQENQAVGANDAISVD